MLLSSSQCSSAGKLYGDESCCDSSCAPKSSTTICRSAVDSCDSIEMCDGSSGLCPRDEGENVGELCVYSNSAGLSQPSNCYMRTCMPGLTEQCTQLVGEETESCAMVLYDFSNQDEELNCVFDTCAGYTCGVGSNSMSCVTYSKYTDTDDEGRIYLSYPLDGKRIRGMTAYGGEDCENGVCKGGVCVEADSSSCTSDQYFEAGSGECVDCAVGCSGGCTGPTTADCTSCAFGSIYNGHCPISADQAAYRPGDGGTSPPPPTPPPPEAPSDAVLTASSASLAASTTSLSTVESPPPPSPAPAPPPPPPPPCEDSATSKTAKKKCKKAKKNSGLCTKASFQTNCKKTCSDSCSNPCCA